MQHTLRFLTSLILSSSVFTTCGSFAADARPNVVYIMADELGYYEPGFNGGTNIKTPNLDRMAAEGMRFKNLFAGSAVCAPTRCCLMTGKHSGHSSVRVNGGGTPLRADEMTIASMLKPLGYATAGFGKWGCGGRDSTGVPEKHGFDLFFGYYDQVHAHTYYLGRQDAGWNGAIKDIEFCISQSPEKFDAPVLKTKLAKKKESQSVECPATKGRYVLLRARSAHSEPQFATVAELGVLGDSEPGVR